MTIDEAVRHCEETAEAKEKIARAADSVPYTVTIDYEKIKACKECANDHRQLASWLGEALEGQSRYIQMHIDRGR